MSQPSFEKFDYTLRPAKNIERKMMCEVFARFAAIAPLHKYRYVGFGSVSCKDFVLVHQRLGISDMISIEREEKHARRFRFNKPYSCIKFRWGASTEVLPGLQWRKRAIVWLDYDGYLDSDVLTDIETAAASVCSGSALVVTVRAKAEEPGIADESADPAPNIHELRFRGLQERVGMNGVPRGVEGKHLAGWGLARVSREIIHNCVVETLAARNGPLRLHERVEYQQLFNFHYADRSRMLTVGGLFISNTDRQRLPLDSFDDLDYVKTGSDAYDVEVPVLTWREATFLDKFLPDKVQAMSKKAHWLPKQERQRYRRLYRYFPTYLEAEL